VEPGSTPRPLVQKKTWRDSLSIDMLLSAVSVLVVAQSSSEIPERLMNNSVYRHRHMVCAELSYYTIGLSRLRGSRALRPTCSNSKHGTCEVLPAVLKKTTVFWDITPCKSVNSYLRFGEACCPPPSVQVVIQ